MALQKNILFIDTNNDSREEVLKAFVERENFHTLFETYFATKDSEALKILENTDIAVIVSDINMLQKDELRLLKSIKMRPRTKDIPIIVAGDTAGAELQTGDFEFRHIDYIHKPYDNEDLRARIEIQLRLKQMHDALKLRNKILFNRETRLMHLMDEKIDEIEKLNLAMVRALESASYFNDEDTGNHLKRVSKYSVVVAEALDCSPDFVKRIKIYAPLHDVGKMGIPDNILKKSASFTPEEADIMQQHVLIGSRFLDNTQIDVMAKNIALYHHERWDGTGYFHGLKGEEIPLEARILAVADVYDALSFDRVYRKALPEKEIDVVFKLRRGTHFDPRLVDIYFNIKDLLVAIKKG